MAQIGFTFGFRPGTRTRRVYILHRALPMTTVLRDFGIELFMYSPYHVDRESGAVRGYVIERGRMVSRRSTVPAVNGDWFLGESRPIAGGMDRRDFARWTKRRGIDLYPDPALSRLLKSKWRTWRLLSRMGIAQPHTERYDRSPAQLERFLDRSPKVFLKPTRGNQGNGIIVLSRARRGLVLAHYRDGARTEQTCRSLAAALEAADGFTRGRGYLVQEGVEHVRLEGRSFVIRVIMVHDGRQWNWFRKCVIGAGTGDVANTSQAGTNCAVEDLLARLYGPAEIASLVESVREASFAVTEAIEQRFPGRVMELALDLGLGESGDVSVLELNTKPGMTKPGLPYEGFGDVFNLTPEEEVLYGRLVVPHATHLAMFLLHKLERRMSREATLPYVVPEGWCHASAER